MELLEDNEPYLRLLSELAHRTGRTRMDIECRDDYSSEFTIRIHGRPFLVSAIE